jgi:predicted phage tail protein
MTQQESQKARSGNTLPLNQIPLDLAEMTRKRIEAFANAQTELWERFQETNKHWLDRMQEEAKLASEFASKVSSARSIPDAMTACQDWGSHRLKMMTDDAMHALDDTQKILQAGAHLIGNGWRSTGLSSST